MKDNIFMEQTVRKGKGRNKMNILIAYFSIAGETCVDDTLIELKVGKTKLVAEKIQTLFGGDLFEIQTKKQYPNDYFELKEVALEELKQNARPELSNHMDQMSKYDAIILGYPNWCGTLPMPVATFLESYDFKGISILPFCTNAGEGLGGSEDMIRELCPDSEIEEGLSIPDKSIDLEEKLSVWLSLK